MSDPAQTSDDASVLVDVQARLPRWVLELVKGLTPEEIGEMLKSGVLVTMHQTAIIDWQRKKQDWSHVHPQDPQKASERLSQEHAEIIASGRVEIAQQQRWERGWQWLGQDEARAIVEAGVGRTDDDWLEPLRIKEKPQEGTVTIKLPPHSEGAQEGQHGQAMSQRDSRAESALEGQEDPKESQGSHIEQGRAKTLTEAVQIMRAGAKKRPKTTD